MHKRILPGVLAGDGDGSVACHFRCAVVAMESEFSQLDAWAGRPSPKAVDSPPRFVLCSELGGGAKCAFRCDESTPKRPAEPVSINRYPHRRRGKARAAGMHALVLLLRPRWRKAIFCVCFVAFAPWSATTLREGRSQSQSRSRLAPRISTQAGPSDRRPEPACQWSFIHSTIHSSYAAVAESGGARPTFRLQRYIALLNARDGTRAPPLRSPHARHPLESQESCQPHNPPLPPFPLTRRSGV
jgi:hypothetical protein